MWSMGSRGNVEREGRLELVLCCTIREKPEGWCPLGEQRAESITLKEIFSMYGLLCSQLFMFWGFQHKYVRCVAFLF